MSSCHQLQIATSHQLWSTLGRHIGACAQVRAAVPMYLLARRIKSLGFKVVMSGEGADEIFGGYLYFHKAPSAAEFHK